MDFKLKYAILDSIHTEEHKVYERGIFVLTVLFWKCSMHTCMAQVIPNSVDSLVTFCISPILLMQVL